MPVFPLFIDLKEKKCIVIGGGKVAERKVETLLEFTDHVTIISPEITEKIAKYKNENRLIVIKKEYSIEDLEGAFMVIAATDNKRINEKIAFDAGVMNIFVNVADSPKKCTFVFPSVVKKDDLIIGISTSGGYPSVSKKLREMINEILPAEFGTFLKVLKETRKAVENRFDNIVVRKELLNKITDEFFLNKDVLTENELKIKIKSIFEEYENEKDN
jgi:precorrin-2 dehydrogenase / sirohydrochlorin ferrochelatase